MKCAVHHAEAVAVCAYCGRAVCADCAKPSATQRTVCSDNCAAAGALGAWFYLPVPFLIWFTAGCGIIFIASGIWHGRIAQKKLGW